MLSREVDVYMKKQMITALFITIAALSSSFAALSATLVQQVRSAPSGAAGVASPVESASFNLTRSRENGAHFNLVVSDSSENVVSGLFSLDQLKTFRAILDEARSFALTDDSVGASRPMTTRFSSKDESGLFVDVAKMGNQSQFFVTVTSETGHITFDAGAITRGNVGEERGLFFDIRSRINLAITKSISK
jgi:hypothetical protein